MSHVAAPVSVEHWFDFICPFCYVAQPRNVILRSAGLTVTELPFQIHPEIPSGGVVAPRRSGPMYDTLAAAAGASGLELNWSSRIAFSRPALALSEVVRTRHHDAHDTFVAAVFDAYFGRGLDIERTSVLRNCLIAAGIEEPEAVLDAAASEEGKVALACSEAQGRLAGVTGTPAWRIEGQLIVGLQPKSVFETIAAEIGSR